MTSNVKLNQIQDNKGARAEAMRVGRGMASGKGKTCGRGMKGLGARSGGKVPLGFEGGQNPLYRRLPMRGFNNHNFRTVYYTINVGELQTLVDAGGLDAKKAITIESLQQAGVTKKAYDGLKVLGNGDVKAKLQIEAAAATGSAVEKIKAAGGELKVAEAKPDMSGKKLKAKAKKEKVSRLEKKKAKRQQEIKA